METTTGDAMRSGDPRLSAICPECGQPRPRSGTTIVDGTPAPSYARACGHPCVRGRTAGSAGVGAHPDKKQGFWDSVWGEQELGCVLGLITGALLLVGVPFLFVGSWVWSRRPLLRWLLVLAAAIAGVAIVWWLAGKPLGPSSLRDPNR